MEKELIKDIIEWDVKNWSKALEFWSRKIDIERKNYTCLELGGGSGGLSLWLALNGNETICSDLRSPEAKASALHEKYNVESNVNYEAIDATDINYTDHFDIVVFKSILGGISRNNKDELKQKTIEEIHKCLKSNGMLLFAENLQGSIFHKIMRKWFVSWGSAWNYLKYSEIHELFRLFKKVEFITHGFWGALGRTEFQRTQLGKIDTIFSKFIPSRRRYIVIGIAAK